MESENGKDGRRLRLDTIVLGIAVLGIAASSLGVLYNENVAGRRTSWVAAARVIQTDALDITRAAGNASQGEPAEFADLLQKTNHLKSVMAALREGDASQNIAAMPAWVEAELTGTEERWTRFKEAIDKVLVAEDQIKLAVRVGQNLESVGAQVANVYDGLAGRLIQGGAPPGKAVTANAQMARTQEIRILGRRLLSDGHNADQIARKINLNAAALASDHGTLESGGEVGTAVKLKRPLVLELAKIGVELEALGPTLGEMQTAAASIPERATQLISAARQLESKLGPSAGTSTLQQTVILPGLAVTVIALVLYLIINVIAVRQRIRRAEENDRQQQAAILSLLDEISTLADGDLTVRANVTGDFTGAIADSINYTVDTLRSLVSTINKTAVELSAAATSTDATATLMKDGSENQATQVVEIANRMSNSSKSLSNIATRADAVSEQARNSVTVAHNGASTVGRSIQGMAALREQIQDTSKRIKRLGESSQEIGNIIEFINDIAEQTNTLALNASIQAAMAGESGRGFAVVADEVQRLAERAAAATRQIETLVNTIQADTKEAIVSMELSTTNVISGARSAEEAGQSLTRIEATSTDLARVIQEISSEAHAEAEQSVRIAEQVQLIRGSAIKTAESAQNTAKAVGELNALSTTLRESVAGFKLPADVSLDGDAPGDFLPPEH
tara:strand:- start:30212 stop:32251 length:2040 start_codon:yes stop_codon:yes gene_type:complete